jgi:pimeloyl-ACP methyl ester carboxylesterase
VKMQNLRKYGAPPYSIAVIHGGPGAPGSMAPVARELSAEYGTRTDAENRALQKTASPGWGVLEPLQTAVSLEGQLQELHDVLADHGDPPATLIGSSWGAMLSYIFAAHHPALVKKLILVGSGGYEDRYAAPVMETRLSRLSEEEKNELETLIKTLNDPAAEDKNAALSRLGQLFTTRTDTYNAFTFDTEVLEVRYDIHQRVWDDASRLRQSGELLELGKRIRCPVVAIHGDHDPHPAAGVRNLSAVLADFEFILLKNCGHYPWMEREARNAFFEILRRELG